MAQNFLACDRDQELLLPPSLREWLPEGHLAWFVIDAVGQLDLRVFYAAYRADGHGRAAHDPAMMVALLLYSYALGVRSSRAIERRCHEDVPTRLRRCREELEAEQAKLEADSQANLRWRQEWEAEPGRKLGGRKPFAPDPAALTKRSINVTDPDSRVVVRAGKTAV